MNIQSLLEKAISRFTEDELFFLYQTGKNELFIRDILALEILQEVDISNYKLIREYGGYRNDLALIYENKPVMVLEAKSWIHSDIVHPTKFGTDESLVKSLIHKDFLKLDQYPGINRYFLTTLFSIDIEHIDSFTKYGQSHLKGIGDNSDLTSLVDTASALFTDFLTPFGQVNRIYNKITDKFALTAILVKAH